MSIFINGLDKPEEVLAIRNALKTMLTQGSFTTEYNIAGTDVRKQMIFKNKEEIDSMLTDCNDFLLEHHLGIPTYRDTQPFIGS